MSFVKSSGSIIVSASRGECLAGGVVGRGIRQVFTADWSALPVREAPAGL